MSFGYCFGRYLCSKCGREWASASVCIMDTLQGKIKIKILSLSYVLDCAYCKTWNRPYFTDELYKHPYTTEYRSYY